MTLILFQSSVLYSQHSTEKFSLAAYRSLDLPKLFKQLETKKYRKIRIDIVDDGFNLNHELIEPYLPKTTLETPNNDLDDDQNGFVDDSHGWNVSDNTLMYL